MFLLKSPCSQCCHVCICSFETKSISPYLQNVSVECERTFKWNKMLLILHSTHVPFQSFETKILKIMMLLMQTYMHMKQSHLGKSHVSVNSFSIESLLPKIGVSLCFWDWRCIRKTNENFKFRKSFSPQLHWDTDFRLLTKRVSQSSESNFKP